VAIIRFLRMITFLSHWLLSEIALVGAKTMPCDPKGQAGLLLLQKELA